MKAFSQRGQGWKDFGKWMKTWGVFRSLTRSITICPTNLNQLEPPTRSCCSTISTSSVKTPFLPVHYSVLCSNYEQEQVNPQDLSSQQSITDDSAAFLLTSVSTIIHCCLPIQSWITPTNTPWQGFLSCTFFLQTWAHPLPACLHHSYTASLSTPCYDNLTTSHVTSSCAICSLLFFPLLCDLQCETTLFVPTLFLVISTTGKRVAPK